MREKTCCLTGHRRLPADTALIERRLEEALVRLIDEGYCYFGVGGALGFDALAADAVLRLRERCSQVRLIVVLACADQDAKWSAADRRRHAAILSAADKVVCLQESYAPDCMKVRDRYLVDHSSVCVNWLTAYGSGTGYTVSYARRQGLRTVDLAQDG